MRKLILSVIMILLFAAPVMASDYKVVIHPPHQESAELLRDEVINHNGRLLVPLRVIADNMGYTTQWAAQNKQVIITANNETLTMQIGSKTADKNGTTHQLDTPPEIYKNRTYVPLRFVGEVFGYYVTAADLGDGYKYAYIMHYPFLPEADVQINNNYYHNPDPYYRGHWIKTGKSTPSGVCTGMTIDEVFSIYGKPTRIVEIDDQYPDSDILAWEYNYANFDTGVLSWNRYFIPQSGYVQSLWIGFKNGAVTSVYIPEDV